MKHDFSGAFIFCVSRNLLCDIFVKSNIQRMDCFLEYYWLVDI